MEDKTHQFARERQEALEFLEWAQKKTGLSYSALAEKGGVAPSTVNRFRKHEVAHDFSLVSRNKIAKACGLKDYRAYLALKQDEVDARIVQVAVDSYYRFKRENPDMSYLRQEQEAAFISNLFRVLRGEHRDGATIDKLSIGNQKIKELLSMHA